MSSMMVNYRFHLVMKQRRKQYSRCENTTILLLTGANFNFETNICFSEVSFCVRQLGKLEIPNSEYGNHKSASTRNGCVEDRRASQWFEQVTRIRAKSWKLLQKVQDQGLGKVEYNEKLQLQEKRPNK